MTSNLFRMGAAMLVSLGLASTTIAAQGGTNGQQAVGTIVVDDAVPAPSPIYGFGFAVTNTGTAGTGGGGGTGKATFENISVTRLPDSASAALFRGAAMGVHYPKAQITLKGVAGGAATTIVLRDVLISAFSNTNGGEEVSFVYNQIEWNAGGASFCFDRVASATC